MKMSPEELASSFTITTDVDRHFLELVFISEDVGMDNVGVQSDLIAESITAEFDGNPDITDWHVLVDTSKTGVYSMSKSSIVKYNELIKNKKVKKVAILLSDTEKQSAVATFALKAFSMSKQKIALFTIPEEANLWLNQ